MTTNGGRATIREVYDISNRLEEKIDRIESRLSIVEGKAWGVSLIVSAVITILLNFIYKQGR